MTGRVLNGSDDVIPATIVLSQKAMIARAVGLSAKGLEQGTYQQPELYGMPASRGMGYDIAPERKR